MSLANYIQPRFTNSFTQEFKFFFLFYLAWTTAHHVSPHLYTYFCTPNTLWGIIASPFMVSAPHCTGLRWAIFEGGNTINAMWFSITAYLTSKMMFRKA